MLAIDCREEDTSQKTMPAPYVGAGFNPLRLLEILYYGEH